MIFDALIFIITYRHWSISFKNSVNFSAKPENSAKFSATERQKRAKCRKNKKITDIRA